MAAAALLRALREGCDQGSWLAAGSGAGGCVAWKYDWRGRWVCSRQLTSGVRKRICRDRGDFRGVLPRGEGKGLQGGGLGRGQTDESLHNGRMYCLLSRKVGWEHGVAVSSAN